MGAVLPDADIDDPQIALIGGVLMLCVGLLMVVVPFVVGYFTLRRRGVAASSEVIDIDEPLPPAI
jgi:hypothetical protein